jgi:hypothetical protein
VEKREESSAPTATREVAPALASGFPEPECKPNRPSGQKSEKSLTHQSSTAALSSVTSSSASAGEAFHLEEEKGHEQAEPQKARQPLAAKSTSTHKSLCLSSFLPQLLRCDFCGRLLGLDSAPTEKGGV